jgi:phytoene dehydrogenase-like protein
MRTTRPHSLAPQRSRCSSRVSTRSIFIARTYLEHEWAGPRSEVSLLEFDKTLGFAGHDRVFPGGYSQITDRLAEGTHILLGHEVKQVDYSGARVDVLTNPDAKEDLLKDGQEPDIYV